MGVRIFFKFSLEKITTIRFFWVLGFFTNCHLKKIPNDQIYLGVRIFLHSFTAEITIKEVTSGIEPGTTGWKAEIITVGP